MPLSGAIFLTKNPRRRTKNKRKARKSVSKRVLVKLNKRRKASRKGKRRNALALRSNKRRKASRRGKRKNALALRRNRKHSKRRARKGGKRRNALALRTNRRRKASRRGGKRRNGLALRTNRRKASRRGGKRRNGLALRTNRRKASRRGGKRRNALALRTNRKHSKRRGGKRKNALALRTNRRRHTKRRNSWLSPWSASPMVGTGLFATFGNPRRGKRGKRRNGMSLALPIGMVQRVVTMVPFVGKPVSKMVAPAVFGALALGGTWVTIEVLIPKALELLPLPEVVREYVDRGMAATEVAKYTLGGALFGALLQFLPVLDKKQKLAIAGSAVVTGAGVDAFRYLTGMGGGSDMGDGGLYELAGDTDLDGVASHYGDAHPGDAQYCGHDLDEAEGRAALSGARGWFSRFPAVTTRVHSKTGMSRHAGRAGHRWGWLIRMIGFERFRQLASQSPAARHKYLAELKQYAITSVPAYEAQVQAQTQQLDAGSELGSLLYAGSV